MVGNGWEHGKGFLNYYVITSEAEGVCQSMTIDESSQEGLEIMISQRYYWLKYKLLIMQDFVRFCGILRNKAVVSNFCGRIIQNSVSEPG